MARKPLDQLSPAYRRRIERGLAAGKTRQEARGKPKHEHRVRKLRAQVKREAQARESAAKPPPQRRSEPAGLGGLTRAQVRRVRRFARAQAERAERTGVPMGDIGEFATKVVGWTMRVGFETFTDVQDFQRRLRRQWLSERRAGLPYPKKVKGGSGLLEQWMARYHDAPGELFFYH